MAERKGRREFLRHGTAATVGLFAAGAAQGSAAEATDQPAAGDAPSNNQPPGDPQVEQFDRYTPNAGGPPGSPTYVGKLVPGLRGTDQPPVPVTTPDLDKMPYRMVDGVKEFEITCEPVKREFLPGYWMDVWGYNGSMPGPTIEANQGDRVRFIVHNKLPEPTTIHWHGLELPIGEDGVPGVTQDPIPPGETYFYEFDLHQAGTFFYHSHFPMQEAFGMVGYFIIHPQHAFDPPVDRDFALIFQNFHIPPNQTIADSMAMDWNWHTINGRSGPFTTPLVCKHGERVRVRIMDFSPQQHHPIHVHGHTFWITGTEGARVPHEAWIPGNTTLIGVAMAKEFEFIAFNPGDWLLHCHMVHHMMNHMVKQVGPRIREGVSVDDYLGNLSRRPAVKFPHTRPGFRVPGYPQKMQGMHMSDEAMRKIQGRREVHGMRHDWYMGVHGLMTLVRVLPEDLFEKLMETDQTVPMGSFFEEIARRRRTEGPPPDGD